MNTFLLFPTYKHTLSILFNKYKQTMLYLHHLLGVINTRQRLHSNSTTTLPKQFASFHYWPLPSSSSHWSGWPGTNTCSPPAPCSIAPASTTRRLRTDLSPPSFTLSISIVTHPSTTTTLQITTFLPNRLFHHSIFWERHVKTAFLQWFHFFTAWKWSSILTENVRLPICNIL